MIGDVSDGRLAVLYAKRHVFDRQETNDSNFSGFSSATDDLILTVTRGPVDYPKYTRRRSLEGENHNDAQQIESHIELTSKRRLLDSHNIDTPPKWLSFHNLPEGSSVSQMNTPMQDIPLPTLSEVKEEDQGIINQAKRYMGRRFPGVGQHHKRHPSPLKRRNLPKSEELPITVNVTATSAFHDNFYPIFLPMDQAYKAKYVFAQKKGKSIQEKTYLFLEHPCGWLCFFYHFAV